jgi:hypothetical protein
MLRRLLRYCDKQYRLGALLDNVRDSRQQPVIGAPVVVRSVLVMALSQLGSLNALLQTQGFGFWRGWIGEDLPSARTIGRVGETLELTAVRWAIRWVYTRMKRNKAIRPILKAWIALVIDGHESNASYVRHCPRCLTRTVHTDQGDTVQYYHRYVMAQLWCESFTLCLDLEPQRPGEDEVAAALRLMERVCRDYPKAFHLILGDSLYARASVFETALKHHKHVITVMKDERRDVLQDVRGLMKRDAPLVFQEEGCRYECWDVEQLSTWDSLPVRPRVAVSLETTVKTSPRTKRKEERVSRWAWATDLSKEALPTKEFVRLAHGRWKIENNGFNELVNQWQADHVYCHKAMEAFWLIIMLAYNLFHAFVYLNLKPQLRTRHTKLFWVSLIASDLFASCHKGVSLDSG